MAKRMELRRPGEMAKVYNIHKLKTTFQQKE